MLTCAATQQITLAPIVAGFPAAVSPMAQEEMIVIDTAVADWERLRDAAAPVAQVVTVGAGQDGLALLAEALLARDPQSGPVAAIHLIGHGEPGIQHLGTATLDAAALNARADLFTAMAAALGGEGALFLHGCAVGAGSAGDWLLAGLAALTGANVAAARQPVGDGYWQLDNVHGHLPDSAAMDRLVASGFSGLLAEKPVLTGGKTDLTYLSNVNNVDNDIPDLDWLTSSTMSADGKFVYVSGRYTDGILVFARDASTGALTLVSQAKNGIDGFAGLTITISPDGKSVYAVVGYDGDDSDIYVFSRNATTGALTYTSKVEEGSNGVSDWSGALGLAVSPDGNNLYVTSSNDDTIVTFTRDTTTGNLTFVEKLQDNQWGGFHSLTGAEDVAISSDGKSVYVASFGGTTEVSTVTAFSRNVTTGALTFVESFEDGEGGVNYLHRARGVTVSPDGAFVYVAAYSDTAVNIFSRDANTSALTYVGVVRNGENGVTSMDGPTKLTVTPDGKALLVANLLGHSVIVFDRNPTTGALTFAEQLLDQNRNGGKLSGSNHVIVSPDGKHAYVTARLDDAVTAFSISPPLITFTEDAGAVALVPNAVLTDADSTNLKRATITLSATPDGAAESLSAIGLSGDITAAYDATTRTLTLSGTASVADYQAALRLVKYNNTSNEPTTTDRTLTITVTDSGDLSSDALTGILSLTNVNDAPTLTATVITDANAAAGSGTAISLFRDTAISTVEAGQGVTRLALTVAGVTDGTKEFLTINGSDIALTNGNAVAAGGYNYAVTLSSGTATVTVTPTSSATTSTIASMVNGITYKNTGSATGTRTVTITGLKDSGGTANGGQDTATLSIATTLTLTKVAPTVTDPVVGGVTVTPPMPVYTEDGNAAAVVPSATLGDVDSANLKRVTVTLTATPDGTAESLSATDLPGGITAAYDATTRTLTLSGTASVAHYQEALRLVKYANTSNEPTTTNRQFTIVATDTDDLSSTGYTRSLSVVAANDAPTLTATANSAAKALAGSGTALSLFHDTVISTVEAGQGLKGLTLTVAGVTDGAQEVLTINGTDIALTNGNALTAGGYSYAVTLTNGTATVTATASSSATASAMASLIDAITYKNTGEAGGHRTVTLTGLTDDGGTANGGHDTASLSVATTLTLMDNPVVSNAGTDTVSYRGNLQTSGFIADALGMSPDGKSVYAASSEGVLEVYSRNTDTGTLTFVSSLRQDEENPNGVNGLIGSTAVGVSADGKSAYVTSFDGKIALFNRDTGTGTLTYAGFVMNGLNGVSGISRPTSITSSSDDKFVYVAGSDGNLVTFSRNTTNGSLTYLGKLQDGVGGVDGLAGANSVKLSPDGTSLYVTGNGDNAVAFFSRDASTGALTYGGSIKDGVGGADGLNQPQDVVVSPDGQFAYVTSSGDDAISIFSRNPSTGALTYVGVVRNGEDGVSGLDGAHKLVVTPDGKSVLAAGILDSSLVQFERNTTTGALTFVTKLVNGVDGVDKLLSPGPVLVSPDGKSAYVASGTYAFLTAFSIDQAASVAAYTEDGGAVALLPAATLSDADSTNLKRATITLSATPDGAAESLSATGLPGGITATYDATTRTLTLSGNATVADYQAALRLVKYDNSSNEPTTTDRSFTVTVTDADDLSSDALTSTLTVTAVNDAPTLTATAHADAKTVAGSGTAASLFHDTAISTVEASQGLKGLTLTVTGVTDGTKEFLTIQGSDIALTNGNTVSANGYSYAVTLASGTATVTVTAASSATIGTMASLIDAITYKSTGEDGGHRTVTITGLTDDGGTANGGHDTASLSIATTVTLMAKPELIAPGLTLPAFAGAVVNGEDQVTGLTGPVTMTISADGKSVYALSTFNSIIVFHRNEDTGALTYASTLENGVGGVSGLLSPTAVTVSGDGHSVYVTSGTDNAIAIFNRDTTTGALTYVAKVKDGVDNVTGLADTSAVTVSPDGHSVYAVGRQGNAIAIFNRDADTGTLTYVGTLQDGVNGVDGLAGASGVTVSPDGKFVYVASRNDNAVAIFNRDSATGALTYVGAVTHGVNGVEGLDHATGISLSPDGMSVYVTGRSEDNTITVFSRDADSGALTYVEVIRNRVNGVEGLFGISPVTVTPDGTKAYVAAASSDAVLVFTRDPATGALTYVDKLVDGQGGGDKLAGASAVIVSPDGKSIYATSRFDNAITTFTAPQITYTEDGSAATLVPDAVLTDNDSATLKRVTVTLSATPDGAAEGLSAVDLPGGITAAYDATTRTLTLSGTASVADYQTALRLVKYANSSNEPTTTARTVTITVTDTDDLSSRPVTGTLSVVSVNDAPTLTATANSDAKATAGSGTAISLFDDTTISTVEAGQGLNGLTLTVGGVTDGAKEFLTINGSDIALTNGNVLTVNGYSYAVTLSSGTATVTMTATSSATASAMASLVDTITYKNTGAEAGTRTVTITGLTDDGGTAHGGHDTASLSVATTVTLMAKPVLTIPGVGEAGHVSHVTNGENGVSNLNKAENIVISPDGKFAYVTGAEIDGIFVFTRNTDTGALTFAQQIKNGENNFSNLTGPGALVMAPDGTSLYASASDSDTLYMFTRNPFTGTLVYMGVHANGVNGVSGLDGPLNLTVAPDGKSLYAIGHDSNTIVTFIRYPDGYVQYLGTLQDGVDGVDGLDGARFVTVSPDNTSVYVTSTGDDAIAFFSRDASTGALTYVGSLKDGVGGVDGLDQASAVTVSPDGKSVYVASVDDDAVSIFSRDAATGALTYGGLVRDGDSGVSGLADPNAITVAPDGTAVYVTSRGGSALFIFDRDATTGALTFATKLVQGAGVGTSCRLPTS
ncbi:beta-propeller fold lactonase family protein [Niveispirillum sp.]|uniref:beta-propeller fold lactonase family protein n=1 Tax=Niveispirillum sp. TaxID=1917217 RepID=UPI001B6869CC|nr:beta-propeller fold lactonase family protein [Niveispirillum sp.]MBP7335501.1 beta-propeller fold lactonase family protein [Niveispirillum sp.]